MSSMSTPLGTLNSCHMDQVDPQVVKQCYMTFQVPVSVMKPNMKQLLFAEKASMMLLLLEALATLAVIAGVRSWFCVVFLIPFFFRYVAFPKAGSVVYAMPSFLVLHSAVLILEFFITAISCSVTVKAIQYNETSYIGLPISLGVLSLVVFLRFAVSVIQQKHYTRIWMSTVLSQRTFFFNLV